MDQYCIPWLQKAAPLAEDIRTLKSENDSLKAEDSAYQKRIIELVIEKQDEQLRSVKTIIEAEMKSYSSAVKSTVKSELESFSAAVSKSCSSAFAPKKLQAVVQKVAEKKERSSNIIIYGLKEAPDENLRTEVETVSAQIDEKPVVKDCRRVGASKTDSIRPVKFNLSSQAHVVQVLKSARKLHTVDGYKSVYICPDRSAEERKAYKKLVEELKKKRDSETDEVYYIRHNKIVSYSKNSEPTMTGNE